MVTQNIFLLYFEKIEKYTTNIGVGIASISIFLAVIAITLATLSRYFFNLIIPGVDELTGYVLVVLTYFGLAYGLKTDSHIYIDLVQKKLPETIRNFLWIIIISITIVLSQIYQYYALSSLIESIELNETALTLLETPLWIPKICICIGWLFFTISLVILLIRKIIQLNSKI